MKRTLSAILCVILAIAVNSCSTPQFDQSLTIDFKTVDVQATKADNATVLTATTVVHFSNRTEKAKNIAIEEGTFYDASGKKSLLRFRPIVPESYGSFATVGLLPMQERDVTIVTPPDMEPFDVEKYPTVRIKYNVTTSDGFRTEVMSSEFAIVKK